MRTRVLVVDDEELICRMIKRLLGSQRRFEIHSATTTLRALQAFDHEGPFDILLADVLMPGVGGVELARQLVGKKPDLKVIFMSGDLDQQRLPENALGLQKPFEPRDLLRAFERALLLPAHREFE